MIIYTDCFYVELPCFEVFFKKTIGKFLRRGRIGFNLAEAV